MSWRTEFTGDQRPVVCLSWHDAVKFCQLLTKIEKKAGRLPDDYVFRLPTEAEWEYACRAGTTGPYAGGQLAELGWYGDNSGSQIHEVGQKRANAWGLYDMHGNVYEWCRDLYGKRDYPRGPVRDPHGPGDSSSHLLRGGNWWTSARYCRSANRAVEFFRRRRVPCCSGPGQQ